MEQIISVVLGGGAGSRLFPLTSLRSKPAVPLAGKYRLIDIPVSNCLNSNILRIFVLTQFNSASLNRHISTAYRFDRFRGGFVSILAAQQTQSSNNWFQGTADAVRQCLPYLNNYRHSHVLVLSGDQLYLMDYRKMLAHHQKHDADITIATIPVHANDASGFGILQTDDNHNITRFIEKPPFDSLPGLESPVNEEMQGQGRNYLASMGIYIFSKGVMKKMLQASPDSHDFGKEIIPSAIKKQRVVSYPFHGYWSDIGTIRSFFEANLMLANRKPEFDLYDPQMPIYTNARMLPPAKIESSYIQDSIVAESCVVVNSQISNSVIGLRSFIGNNTTILNTVIMGADYYRWHKIATRDSLDGPELPGVDEDSYIDGAIIDRNVSIGKRCIIKNRDQIDEGEGPNFYIRDGIVIIPKNATIPDNTII